MLKVSPAPDEVYNSPPFHVHRLWDEQVGNAGYRPHRPDSIFNWDVVRDELAGRVGESNLDNANGAKFDLNQNYLKYAQATGRTTVYPGHEVHTIDFDRRRQRYVVTVSKMDPAGEVLRSGEPVPGHRFLVAVAAGYEVAARFGRATRRDPTWHPHGHWAPPEPHTRRCCSCGRRLQRSPPPSTPRPA